MFDVPSTDGFSYALGLATIAFMFWTSARIATKAGFSGYWGLTQLIPLVSLIALWVFAFSEWPIDRPSRSTSPRQR